MRVIEKIPAGELHWARGPLAALACVLALVLFGCSRPELDANYGRQQVDSLMASASVNGTDVLAGMFTEAGHEVVERRIIMSHEFAGVDVIVWFPDDYAAPSSEVCDWFDGWLRDQPNRTLVYVGRDFDAAQLYWRKMAPKAEEDQRAEYQARALEAGMRAVWRRKEAADHEECDWFVLKSGSPRSPDELSGPWSEGIDAKQTELEITTRLAPPRRTERLLVSGDDILVARNKTLWPRSRLITIVNGSFLLNLPLVNHEHRKLAGKLIAAVGPAGRVVFLSSGAGGPPIDPDPQDNSLWSVFGAWPLSAVLLHLAASGIIFCFARWPIFGRPRAEPREALSDFGKHVAALGELLRHTKDRPYAVSQLAQLDEARARAAPADAPP